ncbi:hypothetical protein [Maribacter sp. IgM3_T14_3]|uniref:hypothetical protein n=1 Tax=Maribacter sp. IgM3_T14_3 TaxID=3415140 RepID=UPI003C6F20E9
MRSLKKIFVLAVLALFAMNCEKGDSAQINEETQVLNFSASAFSSSEIPDIVSSFKKRVDNRRNSINSKEEQQTFWVDEESAIGVRDSIGNMTYTFRMYVENGQENSVYNLVVNRRTDGNHSPDFVMKYEFIDQDILEYSQSQDKSFNGKIDAYSFDSFLSSLGNSSKGGSTEPCYDDIGPDPSTNNTTGNTGGSTSGGSGSNSGSGYNAGATTTAGSTSWASAGSMGYTGAQASGGSRGTVEVGKGCFCATMAPDTKDQKSTTSKGDDCPKGEMLIGINITAQKITKICGDYNFKKIGNANYANISNLNLLIVSQGIFSNDIIEVDLKEIAVGIPYLSTRAASNAFNSAWEQSKYDLYEAMSVNPKLLNDASATIAFRDFLIDNLKAEQAGSSISTRPISSVPSTRASYCL